MFTPAIAAIAFLVGLAVGYPLGQWRTEPPKLKGDLIAFTNMCASLVDKTTKWDGIEREVIDTGEHFLCIVGDPRPAKYEIKAVVRKDELP